MVRLVVIGNGVAGITAALAFRRENRDASITVISDESELFYSRTALMYIYMRDLKFTDTVVHPRAFYKKQNISLCFSTVSRVDFRAKEVLLADKTRIPYDFLLLAPGSRPRLPGIQGENLEGVQGLYSRADLARLEDASSGGISRAVIVGGGLIGVELAEMLHRRRIPVTFLVRDERYFGNVLPREEAEMITREILGHGIDLRLQCKLRAIHAGNGRVARVTISRGEDIPCDLLGLTIGVAPRLELVAESPVKCSAGILTNENLQTNLPEVFAAGDAAEPVLPGGQRKVQQLWYTGRMQGEVAGYNLAQAAAGRPFTAYDPGIFFNSAKFFSIEYQTYGLVPATASDQNSILWQNAAAKKLIRIGFTEENGSRIVTGFNVLGIRYRHQVCEAWIRERAPLQRVLAELKSANFDPEFYERFEKNLRSTKEHEKTA